MKTHGFFIELPVGDQTKMVLLANGSRMEAGTIHVMWVAGCPVAARCGEPMHVMLYRQLFRSAKTEASIGDLVFSLN